MTEQTLLQALEDVATRLRVEAVRATTAAGSGHPTSAAPAIASSLTASANQ